MAVRDVITASAADFAPHPWVLTVRGPSSARQVLLAEGTVTLGGSRLCGVVLEGSEVAGQHARLQVAADTAILSILPNATPAVLHGVRVQRAGLASGDSFRLGDLQLTLRRRIENGLVPQPGERPAAPVSVPGRPLLVAERPLLACLEDLLTWSQRGPSSERGGRLATLCGELDAEAGCLFTVDAGGQLAVVTAWGDPTAGTDGRDLARLVRQATGEPGTAVVAADGLLVAGIGGLPGGGFGLLVRGRQLSAEAPVVLRLAVRLFAHEALREQAMARVSRVEGGGLRFPPGVVIGRSPAMRRLYDQLERMADGQLPALIVGETGVGKEHVAQLVHDSSRRRERPFVTINCAAIPAELLESELFGIGRGVATGVNERAGKFREAHGGTLFLDEVGELPLALQAKLLRALEEKKVQPVGGQASAVDLRIVAATNSRLDEAARRGSFRLDLYYRLAGFVVVVPPLRERPEDVPLLFDHFLREVAAPPPRVAPRALSALVRHRWEGNVRELRHEALRAGAHVGPGGTVDLDDLSPAIATGSGAAGTSADEPDEAPGHRRTLDGELARLEKSLIGAALSAAGGNVSEAARALGVSRTRLYRHLAATGRAR